MLCYKHVGAQLVPLLPGLEGSFSTATVAVRNKTVKHDLAALSKSLLPDESEV